MSNAILLVDDEPSVLSAICRSLRGEPYEIITELSGEMALDRMQQQPFKVVVSDERMARMQGSEFLSIVRNKFPGTVRILLTGHASLDAAMRAVNEGGIYKFLVKPWDDKALKETIREAICKHDAEQEAWSIFGTLQQKQHDVDLLEMAHPGISHIERDSEGSLILPELSDNELEALRRQCELAFIGSDPALDPAEQVRDMLLQKFTVRES
jgi:two-component system, probable response regulator PhcQ